MIQLKNIKKIYNKGKTNEFEALHDVSLKIEDGELIAIIGKSGAGKSTLLHILSCIDSYENGEFFINDTLIKNKSDRELAKIRNKKIGMVMQDFALIEEFTCLENVMIPLNFSKEVKMSSKEKTKKSTEALKKVSMDSMLNKSVNCLSGGQKQRVAIARAIVNEPDVILADEPTGALDTSTAKEIMDVFHELNKQGKTIIIVTHDKEVAAQCNRIIEISDGNIV